MKTMAEIVTPFNMTMGFVSHISGAPSRVEIDPNIL